MPVCFQLSRKTDMGAGPVKLSEIDEEMCKFFNQPIDPVKYLGGWYDSIGLRLALGKTFEQIRTEFKEYAAEKDGKNDYYKTALLLVDWLDEHFTSDSWRSVC